MMCGLFRMTLALGDTTLLSHFENDTFDVAVKSPFLLRKFNIFFSYVRSLKISGALFQLTKGILNIFMFEFFVLIKKI